MESQAVFERNLLAIRKRTPSLADALEVAGTDGVDVEIGPRGAEILVEKGVRLGSAYDPVREGAQIAASMAEEPADIMIAAGFGLGEQFEPYLESNPGTLVIYEPSIARLAAALRRISIVNLLAKHHDVFLATDINIFKRLFGARYAPGLRVRVFPHPAVLRLDPQGISNLVEATLNTKEVVDTQRLTSIEMLMPWALMTANNGRRIAQTPQLGVLKDAFKNKPAVVVAAGPSLDKQLPLLREIQDRVVIIAIGQTAKALQHAGIEPHLVHLLESRDVSHQLTELGAPSDLIVAPSADAHPAVFDVPTRAKFTVTPLGGVMGVWIAAAVGETSFTMGGGTVAQGAVGMALQIGCNPIALIGQDLAFTDGRVYASNSAYDFVNVDISDSEDCQFSNMQKKADLLGHDRVKLQPGQKRGRRVVWVDGWNEGERVPTWRAYASFLDQYREIGIGLRGLGRSLINCTEGGARIPEVEHRTFQSFADEFAVDILSAREKILAAYDGARRFEFEDYRGAIERAEKALARIEEEAKKGDRFGKKKREKLLSAKSDQQRLDVLRGFARHEKRVRKHLEQIPWLDALVQPEIYNAIAATRRTERLDPSDEDLADESAFLFRAALNGIARARVWFDAFEHSFSSDSANSKADSASDSAFVSKEKTEGLAPRIHGRNDSAPVLADGGQPSKSQGAKPAAGFAIPQP